MAQKRMIDKKISVSEQVANLPLEAQLIFTWSIPHADDLGLLPISLRTLKAMIIPMLDISLETFGIHMESIVSQGLYDVFEHEGERFYRIKTFLKNQTLKKDRKPNTFLKNINSWDDLETIGFHLEDIGNPSKEKRSKDKLSKEKGITPLERKPEYLRNIPQSDLTEFSKTYSWSNEDIKTKGEDLALYCESKGKTYRNYRAFLQNALRNDRPKKKADGLTKTGKYAKYST